MWGNAINELNAGLKQFIQETANDEAASMSVELEVITFDSYANVVMPFTPISDVERDPSPLIANGMTAMGAGLALAYKDLQERRKLYSDNGISAYKPWVILMTDGGPNDEWQESARKMRELGEKGKIQYIGLEIGDSVDHSTMLSILPANSGPVKLKGLRFKQFFKWLTDSLSSVSASTVSEEDNICFGNINLWADITNC
jgi:uncharacterized protein YegL